MVAKVKTASRILVGGAAGLIAIEVTTSIGKASGRLQVQEGPGRFAVGPVTIIGAG